MEKYLKPRVGLYSMGLYHYWDQFDGLQERLLEYGNFIASELERLGADVYFYGLVDSEVQGAKAGDFFAQNHVDIIFAHAATYVTSASILPVHQRCKAYSVVLNLQPAKKINYKASTTGEWLAHCGACPVPEISNAFERANIKFNVVNGLLGMDYTPEISLTNEDTKRTKQAMRAWEQIKQWVISAKVKRNLANSRIGFLGNTYSGMLDLYSDFTMIQGQLGVHVQQLEMCDLNRHLDEVTEKEIEQKLAEIESFFNISDDNSADPMAKKPDINELRFSAKVAAAQEKLVDEFQLNGLTYYYHGSDNNLYEKIQSAFIVGHSLLTSNGVPCAGEGDLKTCIAMKICDIIGIGGSFCEIVVVDYEDDTILLGHDGPFHLKIAQGKPILRGLGVYHGKKGSGVSVEAKVKSGDITNLGCTQMRDGKLKFIISQGTATGGEIMTIGNTQTPVKFSLDPDSYMDSWFKEAPTHHFAMSVGNNAELFSKIFELIEADYVII